MLIWIGVALLAAGLSAIVYSWSKVAGLTNVAEQVPYFVSGGIGGLAVVIVGAAAVDAGVRHRDSRERHEQLAHMSEALSEVCDRLETGDGADHAEEGGR